MNNELLKLADNIRQRFPEADVRTDQSETIRVIARTSIVGVSIRGGEYQAKVVSLGAEDDFETTLLKTLTSRNADDFKRLLLDELSAVLRARIDYS